MNKRAHLRLRCQSLKRLFFALLMSVGLTSSAQVSYNVVLGAEGTTVKHITKEFDQYGYTVFTIQCTCYAERQNLQFSFSPWKQKKEVLTKLPDSTLSTMQFIKLANENLLNYSFAEKNLYLIEKVSDTLYVRYAVFFYRTKGIE